MRTSLRIADGATSTGDNVTVAVLSPGKVLCVDQERRQEIAELLLEKRELENTWNARQTFASCGWRVLNKWRYVRNRLAAERTWPRKLYDEALHPFRGHSSEP
jgi:hypothetical protein